MGDYNNCSDWDYSNHPKINGVVYRSANFLAAFRRKTSAFDKFGYSTLRGHWYLFYRMAPDTCPYLVGNYRGSNYPCLINCRVTVGMDNRVGWVPPHMISNFIQGMEDSLQKALVAFATQNPVVDAKGKPAPNAVRLSRFIPIVANFLQLFLTIHPYANGNGHMARMLVWVLLGRAGFWPRKWPLHSSPNYYTALSSHRDGNKAPLEQFILSTI